MGFRERQILSLGRQLKLREAESGLKSWSQSGADYTGFLSLSYFVCEMGLIPILEWSLWHWPSHPWHICERRRAPLIITPRQQMSVGTIPDKPGSGHCVGLPSGGVRECDRSAVTWVALSTKLIPWSSAWDLSLCPASFLLLGWCHFYVCGKERKKHRELWVI